MISQSSCKIPLTIKPGSPIPLLLLDSSLGHGYHWGWTLKHMNVSFALHKKLYSFMRVHSLTVHLSIYSNILFRHMSPKKMSSGLFSILPYIRFSLCWGLWSTWTWQVCGSTFILLQTYMQLDNIICWICCLI